MSKMTPMPCESLVMTCHAGSLQGLESLEKPWIRLDQIKVFEILEFYKVVLNLIVVNKILFWLNSCDE